MVGFDVVGDSYLVTYMYTVGENYECTPGLLCHIQDPTLYIHDISCVSGFRIWGEYTEHGDYGSLQPGYLFRDEVW